jgi:hypothetical protein
VEAGRDKGSWEFEGGLEKYSSLALRFPHEFQSESYVLPCSGAGARSAMIATDAERDADRPSLRAKT